MIPISQLDLLCALWVTRINKRAYNAIQVAESLGISLVDAMDRCLLVRALGGA